MKKSFISLICALFILLNMLICPIAFAEETENMFPSFDNIGKEHYASAKNLGFDILQNDKYVLIAEGTKASAFSNDDIHLDDKIHIYEKPNEKHLDYKYLTTIKQDSSNASYDLPARSISLNGDILYVYWGNALFAKNTAGAYSSCGKTNPIKYYDLSFKEAITKLNNDFNLGLPIGEKLNRRKRLEIAKKSFDARKQREEKANKLNRLKDNRNKALDEWVRLDKQKLNYKPKIFNEVLHPLFVEAIINLPHAEYRLECAETELYLYETRNHCDT